MQRARRRRRFNREKGPWSWFRRRPKLRERFCPKCERPYFETPMPREEEQIVCGSSAGLIYELKRWGRKDYVVQFGRCQSNSRSLYLSQLFSADDLDDLIKAAAKARSYVNSRKTRSRG